MSEIEQLITEHDPSENKPIEYDKTMWAYFLDCLTPSKNYFNFKGRARRKEYFAFQFFHLLIIAIIILATLGTVYLEGEPYHENTYIASGIALVLFMIYSFIPMLSVSVRRFHDLNYSGWWLLPTMLLTKIFLGLIGYFFLVFIAGKDESNRFGKSQNSKLPWHFIEELLLLTVMVPVLGVIFFLLLRINVLNN